MSTDFHQTWYVHILWRQFSASGTSDFTSPGDNLSTYQGIFTELGICIDLVEIWFGIA